MIDEEQPPAWFRAIEERLTVGTRVRVNLGECEGAPLGLLGSAVSHLPGQRGRTGVIVKIESLGTFNTFTNFTASGAQNVYVPVGLHRFNIQFDRATYEATDCYAAYAAFELEPLADDDARREGE